MGFGNNAEYGPHGRVSRTFGDDGSNELQFDYRPFQQLTRIRNALGDVTEYHYDDRLQMSRVVDALGRITRYE
ncbi:hypothetical protein, partial [Parachitinimonas caeni]